MIDKNTPIEKLKELTQEKKYKEIKNFLTSLDKIIKGRVFEEYLQYLYEGNGFRVKLNGGRDDLGADLLLYHPADIQKPILIIQAKNQKEVLTFKDTQSEVISFERKAQEKWACNQFRIVCTSGFTESSNELKRFNIVLNDWSHVEELIKTYSTDIQTKPKLFLFSHNLLAFEETIKLFQKNNRVAVVQATGTGKSHIIAQLILEYWPKKILFLSPSNLIFNQFQESFNYISQVIDFLTYQQLTTDVKSGKTLKSYDFIILDEFHRIGAEKWGKSVDALLSKNENSKVLGTTATPIRYLDGRRDMAEKFQARPEDLSLADAIERKILPRPLYISSFYSVAEEIKTLEDEISNANISKDESNQYKEELKNIAIDWEESRGVPELLKKHLKPSMRKFVVFCRDKKHLNDMSDVVSTWFRKSNPKLKREKYQITSGDLQNKKTLQMFKDTKKTENTIHLLFCIDMLNEGLHIEGVHGVILLRTTESPIIFYQQIGRCLKVQSGSDNQPIIFDLVNNFKSIKSNDFKTDLDNSKIKVNKIRAKLGLSPNMSQVEIIDNTTWFDEILSRIREQIENWEVRFQQLVDYKEEFGNCDVPNDYPPNKALGLWGGTQRTNKKKDKLGLEKTEKLEEIGFKWNPYDTAWEKSFNELQAYKKEFGNCDVQKKYRQNNALGSWVDNQRQNNKKRKLGLEKFKKLEELGFNWDPYDAAWEASFNELSAYKKEFGNCDVQKDYQPNEGLGLWVSNQRANKKKGKLDQERTKKLNELGFKWEPRDTIWETSFNELVAYKKEFGNCDVPVVYSPNKILGKWVDAQRTNKKKRKLDSERIKKLEKLEFNWSPGGQEEWDIAWEKNFNDLIAYKKEFWNCNVPQNYKQNKTLGKWIAKQRINKKKGILDQERTKKLNELGFNWSPRGQEELDTAWKTNFNELIAYKKEFGNCDVPAVYPSNKALGKWAHNQRTNKKKGKLDSERSEQLEELGFKWDPQGTAWETSFNELISYKKKFGDCDVPKNYPANIALGSWVGTQRTINKKGELESERTKKLEKLGFNWSPGGQEEWDIAWEKNFNDLIAYKKEFGDCNVPQDYKQNKALGLWVCHQRQNNKKGKLCPEKSKKLEELGFNWDPYDAAWEASLNELLAYKKEFGNCDVQKKYRQSNALGSWVCKQRQNNKKGKLGLDKFKKLKEIGFNWSPGGQEERDTAWETSFNDLISYKKKFGDCDVPAIYPSNKALGNWVDRQRQNKKKGKLTLERTKKLEELGFKWSLHNQESKEVTEKEIKIKNYLKPNKPQIELFPDH